jgi:hypothetical protein
LFLMIFAGLEDRSLVMDGVVFSPADGEFP